MDRRKSTSRAGFTLIEVLVAILIVATLVALLLPAVRGAYRKAQEAQVGAELNNLGTALASFKNTYGDYPPSRVVLCERGFSNSGLLNSTAAVPPGLPDANCSDITVGQLAQRTLLYMRRFWPRADFLSDPGPNAQPGTYNDFDGSGGTPNPNPVYLSGSECLTFFLGGLPINTGQGYGTSGFSKSPTYPFVDSVTALNRSIANYEFVTGRLIDLDGDNFPSYLDPINTVAGSQRAYAYFVSYGTNSYDPNDVNGDGQNNGGFEMDSSGSNISEWGFTVTFPVMNQAGPVTTVPTTAISPAPNPYTAGPSNAVNPAWINPNSFQLLFCGVDQLWGTGGAYAQGAIGDTGNLPLLTSGNVNGETDRIPEYDNVSNFSTGRMK